MYIVSFDPGTVNLGYCVIHVENLKINKWGILNIKHNSIEGSTHLLIKQLNDLKLTELDEEIIVMIECQIGINKKTNIVLGSLFMYYEMEKINNKNSKIKKIVTYPAKNKMSYYNRREGDEDIPYIRPPANRKDRHRYNKKLIVEHCKRILKHNNEIEFNELFIKSKKKDDLADSYIQGLTYIRNL